MSFNPLLIDTAYSEGLGFYTPPDPPGSSGGDGWIYEDAGGIDWGSIIGQGISTTPAIIGAVTGHPVSGTFPGGGQINPYQTGIVARPGTGVSTTGQLTFGSDGLHSSGGFSIGTNTLIIGGLVLALFMMSQGRGKGR